MAENGTCYLLENLFHKAFTFPQREKDVFSLLPSPISLLLSVGGWARMFCYGGYYLYLAYFNLHGIYFVKY